MATPAQAAAGRRNSLLSTGPKTAAGKEKMRDNPLRHGLTARHIIIPGERQEDFDRLLADLREDYEPAGHDEAQLVATLAEHYWRLLRARRVETATLSLYVERILEEEEAGGDPDRALALAFERHGRELDRLRRYEVGIERTYLRVRRELEDIQSTRFRMEAIAASAPELEERRDPALGSVLQTPPVRSAVGARTTPLPDLLTSRGPSPALL